MACLSLLFRVTDFGLVNGCCRDVLVVAAKSAGVVGYMIFSGFIAGARTMTVDWIRPSTFVSNRSFAKGTSTCAPICIGGLIPLLLASLCPAGYLLGNSALEGQARRRDCMKLHSAVQVGSTQRYGKRHTYVAPTINSNPDFNMTASRSRSSMQIDTSVNFDVIARPTGSSALSPVEGVSSIRFGRW